jgi:chaperonin GroEL
MSAEEVKFGVVTDRMLRGVEILNNAIKVTRSRAAMSCSLSRSAPRMTKDGVTIAKKSNSTTSSRTWARNVREVASKASRRGQRRHHHRDRAGGPLCAKAPSQLPPA